MQVAQTFQLQLSDLQDPQHLRAFLTELLHTSHSYTAAVGLLMHFEVCWRLCCYSTTLCTVYLLQPCQAQQAPAETRLSVHLSPSKSLLHQVHRIGDTHTATRGRDTTAANSVACPTHHTPIVQVQSLAPYICLTQPIPYRSFINGRLACALRLADAFAALHVLRSLVDDFDKQSLWLGQLMEELLLGPTSEQLSLLGFRKWLVTMTKERCWQG